MDMQETLGSGEIPTMETDEQSLDHKIVLASDSAKNSQTDISIGNEAPHAVCIQNLNKRYDKNGPAIIDNLCMNVRKGTIYGLLGASGCGKTTVLSCIVGLKKWDSGDVLVFGERPGSKESGIPGKKIGYMPQDLALYNQLSFREIAQFYGRIYNMTGKEIAERWKFLCQLLELPVNFKLISDFSGGQKRRISLALALLHLPELLVLDEPTVGLDPLLRASIWSHLHNTVSTLGTTIIITTHYVEETRLSDTIGVMRNGHLLVEESPMNLLNSYKCELLEQVVLQLCRQNESDRTKNVSKIDSSSTKVKGQVEFKSTWKDKEDYGSVFISKQEHNITLENYQMTLKIDHETSQQLREQQCKNEQIKITKNCCVQNISAFFNSIRRIYGLTTVLLLTFIRYPVFLAFLLVMPAFQGAVTLWAVGPKPTELGFGIINHELENWTDECSLPQHYGNYCDISLLSCKYINLMKQDRLFNLKPYKTEKEALDHAHLGQLWGYLTFPPNFTQHTVDRLVANKFAFNESIQGSEIHVRLDQSHRVDSYFMIKNLIYSYLDYVKQLVTNCDLGGQQADIPLMVSVCNFFGSMIIKPVYGNTDDDFTTFIMPGVILIFLYAVPCTLTAMLCVTDRKQGTLGRAVAAGLKTADVITSHLITQAIFSICIFLIWNVVVHYLFGISNNGTVWLYLIFFMFAALSGTGLGLFIGNLCNDEVEVMVVGVFLAPTFLLFGGIFFPLENMSKFWQIIGKILPTTMSTLSLRSVIVRGADWMHPTVWPGVLVLVAWIVVMPPLSAMTFRKSCS